MRPAARSRRVRLLRALATVVAGVGLAVAPLVTQPAGADHSGELFVGFTFLADSDGYKMTGGDPKAQGYPQGQGSVGHTQARLSTGPAAHALASTAWPGGFFGNFGSLIQAFGAPPEAGQLNYPVRAEAQSSGPTTDERPGMKALAEGELAEATSTTNQPRVEGAFSAGQIDTLSRSTIEGEFGVTRAETTMSDVVVAAGTVTIDSVVTVAEARTNGIEGSNGGRTVVEGMEVGGQPVVVDENGVRAGDSQNDNPANAVTQALVDNVLTHAQMEIYLTEPLSRSEGGVQEYRSGSLIIVWQLSEGDPRYEDGAIFVMEFGGSGAYVGAQSAILFQPPDISIPDFTVPPAIGGGTFEPPPAPTAAPTTPGPTEVAAPPSQPRTIVTEPVVDRFDGIPWLLVLAVVGGSLIAGRGLTRFHAALVESPPSGSYTIEGGHS
jgi:hypothetical protein